MAYRVIFLNVTQNEEKGDAVLVDCNGKYVLIDGGHEKNHTYLRAALKKYCALENGKIVLQAVVVSHFHPDHYGGIKMLFDYPKFNSTTPEVVIKNAWRTNIYDKENANSYGHKSIRHLRTLEDQGKVKGHVLTPAKENGKSLIRRVGDATGGINGMNIDLYAPAKDFRSTGASDVSILNNCSIIANIHRGNSNCLVVGDQTFVGIEAAIKEYSQTKYGAQALFTKAKTPIVCKYGHHGVRGTKDTALSNNTESQFQKEIKLYNQSVGAGAYVFTPAKTQRYPTGKDAENVAYNFGLLETKLNGAKGNKIYTFNGDKIYTL